MKKVVKFGGSSLASAEQFKKRWKYYPCRRIQKICCTICSGKAFSADTKVTDMLYGCYAAAENGEDFTESLQQLKIDIRKLLMDLV